MLPGNSAVVLHEVQNLTKNSAKETYIDPKFLALLIMPQDQIFGGKLILGPAPAGAPKNLFLAQGVLETSSFQCLLQHIFLILK